jgi:hypothetical protein
MKWRIIWAIWLAGVIVGSLLPGEMKEFTHTTGLLHRAVHIVAFAALAIGVSSWFRGWIWKFIANAGFIILGVLLELLQHYFYGGVYRWADVFDDSIGVLAGLCLRSVYVMWTKHFGERDGARRV